MYKEHIIACHNFVNDLIVIAKWIKEGHNLDEIRKFHLNYEHDLVTLPKEDYPSYCENEIVDTFRIIKEYLLGDDENWTKVSTVIDEWNTYVAPILTDVTCNSFDEFAMQVALVVENTYLKSLNASKDEEIKVFRERLVALGQPV